MANKKYRVLVAGLIGGLLFRPDDVASLPDAVAKAHAESIDGNKEAVAYALNVNGGVITEYKRPVETSDEDDKVEIAAALQSEVAALEAQLAKAVDITDEDKVALEARLAEKQAELADLKD